MRISVCWALSALFAGAAYAVPPVPGLIERMREAGTLNALIAQQTDARARGVDSPFQFNRAQFMRDGSDEVVLNVICILVDFDDNQADQQSHSVEYFQRMLFSEGEYETGSLRDWYKENSYGSVQITGQVVGWYRMPNPYGYYVDGQQGHGQFPRNAQGLTLDALTAADADVDFTEFDNNGNRIVEGLFIVHAGPGAEENGDQDLIWSHAWSVPNQAIFDTMHFATYAMEPENGHIGVFGHELGHSLFGLPDLYDIFYASSGIGSWSMMAGGCWGGGGTRPVHFDAFCKQRIGFVEPYLINDDTPDIVLDPVESSGDVLKLWRRDDWGSEYFLIENRQKVNFDRDIPGSGMLIWHCDENAENNAHPWWPDHQNNGHYKVALEQADGAYELEQNVNWGDEGDPWPGLTQNELFDEESSPTSNDYHDNPTGVTISRIALDEAKIACNIFVEGPADDFEPILYLLERIPESHKFPNPDRRLEADTTNEVDLVLGLLNQISVWPVGHGDSIPENVYDYNTIIYLESWRDDDNPAPGLTERERNDLAAFIDVGGRVILVGPDVATNMSGDSTLWMQLHANLISDGESRVEGNVRELEGSAASRIDGEDFIYFKRGICDHYVDVVGPGTGAQSLFTDDQGNARGVLFAGRNGSRVILQPVLFGGMIDFRGSKVELMRSYFQYLKLTPMQIDELDPLRPVFELKLESAWPNPFNGTVSYSWSGAREGAKLIVRDVNGRSLGQLLLNRPSGKSLWNASGFPTGTYFLCPENQPSKPMKIQLVR